MAIITNALAIEPDIPVITEYMNSNATIADPLTAFPALFFGMKAKNAFMMA